MRSKKSQTEVIGLVIIVIILVIGGIFLVSLGMKKKDSPTAGYQDAKLAQSFLNAIMNTKTEKNVILFDIIKEGCYNNRNELCGKTDCCAYARTVMDNALKSTLKDWKKKYELTVKRGTDEKITAIKSDSPCSALSESNSAYYPIPDTPKIVVTLKICK